MPLDSTFKTSSSKAFLYFLGPDWKNARSLKRGINKYFISTNQWKNLFLLNSGFIQYTGNSNIYHKMFAIHSNTAHSDEENSYNANGLGCFGSDEDGFFLFSCSYVWNKYGLKAKSASDASIPVNFMGMILCLSCSLQKTSQTHGTGRNSTPRMTTFRTFWSDV